MCGHEKYLKTTMHGLTSLYPDYCLLAIGANMGVSKMTKEHIGISWALDLPMFVVFTKVDLAPKDIFDQNMKKISKLMRQNCNKIPVQMKTSADIEKAKEAIGTGKVCPIFTVSNVTGEGVDLLRQFLAMLPKSIVRE